MKPKVAVVILNWNGKQFLEKFLGTVVDCSGEEADVYVADNASQDGSVEYIQTVYPNIKLIRHQTNLGFTGGYNAALKLIQAEYYILLNSDIEVTPGWITPVIELMESDPNIAACQPKLLDYYHRDKFEYAGASGGFIDKYGYPFCRGRMFQILEQDNGQYDDNADVFWATGACFFVKSEVFHTLSGFDNRFFAHMEEIDFCWRAKNNGYRIMVCPQARVYHIGGGTLPKQSWRKTYLNIRNNNIMLFKNLPRHRLLPVLMLRLLLDGLASVKFVIDGGFRNLLAVVKAHWQFFGMIPQLSRERKNATGKEVPEVYLKSVVADYFIRNKKTFSALDKNRFRKNLI
jgi:GT2 family glycosyltransferase